MRIQTRSPELTDAHPKRPHAPGGPARIPCHQNKQKVPSPRPSEPHGASPRSPRHAAERPSNDSATDPECARLDPSVHAFTPRRLFPERDLSLRTEKVRMSRQIQPLA